MSNKTTIYIFEKYLSGQQKKNNRNNNKKKAKQ